VGRPVYSGWIVDFLGMLGRSIGRDRDVQTAYVSLGSRSCARGLPNVHPTV